MELQDYLQIFLKRKWMIIFSFFFVFLGAISYILVTPKMYKSTTTILIIPQRVPENYVRSTLNEAMEARLATIEQQLTSRTRLMKVMEELGLFKTEREEMAQESVIEKMTKRIEIDVAQSQTISKEKLNEAFTISFLYEDPKLAMLTANRIASLFIEENLKSREKRAVGTAEFLESQLKRAKGKLEAQEEKVRQYKMRYSGQLPQELQANLNSLGRLQEQYRINADEISAAEQRKLTLQSQLGSMDRGLQAVLHEDGRVEVDTSENTTQAIINELNARRSQLNELSAKYTDQYPDVVRVRQEVEQLEKKLAEVSKAVPPSRESGKEGSIKHTNMPFTGLRTLKAQLASTDAEIAALKRERETIRRNISAYQAKVDMAPRRDLELVTLTRDYDNLKKSYDDLLQKRDEATISEKLEISQKGDQFQILDPANLPEKPFKPKPKIIFSIAFLMAGFLGLGGAIGMEKLDLSLRGVTDFKHFFDLPILASIPILETVEIERRQNIRRKAIIGGMISFALFLFAFLLLVIMKLTS
jgi:polysaccharide chain length determinant protein (PEP-CTERM system associated)